MNETESLSASAARAAASEVITELKEYIAENANSKFSTVRHTEYILDCVTRVINIYEQSFVLNMLKEISGKIDTMNDHNLKNDSILVKQDEVLKRLTALDTNKSTVSNTTKLYSTALKARGSASTKQKHVPTTKNVLLIYNASDNGNSDDVCKIIKERVNPSRIKIGVDRVRRIGNGGIAVELEKSEDINVLDNYVKEHIPEVNTKRPKKRRPHLMIFSIPKHDTKEELLRNIYYQNESFHSLYSEEDFKQDFRLKFSTGKRGGDYQNWVIEVSPSMRAQVLRLDKLNIGWSRCRAIDFCPVLQCFC
ncbi:uncharacterized protein LOC111622731 [Centruroides sculpturatus]|uniref:uncharacterized protein LOC111622731 n=1 Tax=Centruroides sculpturatus TaxID=218467 RepID=UPI000C6D5C04|nr:uncharacterized protein LOC111622731 [Centruroides sculpturatus]